MKYLNIARLTIEGYEAIENFENQSKKELVMNIIKDMQVDDLESIFSIRVYNPFTPFNKKWMEGLKTGKIVPKGTPLEKRLLMLHEIGVVEIEAEINTELD